MGKGWDKKSWGIATRSSRRASTQVKKERTACWWEMPTVLASLAQPAEAEERKEISIMPGHWAPEINDYSSFYSFNLNLRITSWTCSPHSQVPVSHLLGSMDNWAATGETSWNPVMSSKESDTTEWLKWTEWVQTSPKTPSWAESPTLTPLIYLPGHGLYNEIPCSYYSDNMH